MQTIQLSASSYLHAGLSVIPTASDKRPTCSWKPFTERPMTDVELERYFAYAEGVGIVTGKVSGNLEVLDFDNGGSEFEPWYNAIPKEIASRLVVEASPSGGKHVYYRIEDAVPGNRKLAMTEDGKVLIETRGEGGYIKCTPSKGYTLLKGDFLHIPSVNPMEHQLMIEGALSLSREAKPKAPEVAMSDLGRRLAASHTTSVVDRMRLESTLVQAGWTKIKDGAEQYWRRPGKTDNATSATFNGDVFYVFSSNAAPFEPNKGYSVRSALHLLGVGTHGCGDIIDVALPTPTSTSTPAESIPDPGPLPEELLSVPGFVNMLMEHTLATAPYPNKPLAFAGALTMLAHLTGRNFRNPRNLRTNLYLLALADSGVGKDYPRKVNMNLASEVGIMPTMADRFASAEGLEDALLIHPASFFEIDEADTLFSELRDKKDSAIEKIYGALLQFATSSDTTYAMRKKAIQQTTGKASKFDKIRARGIKEPHLTLLGTAIPKYLYSALSERSLENGLISRCLILEAGERGKFGNPHAEPFKPELLNMAHSLVAHGGFEGLDLEDLDAPPPPYLEPITVPETEAAARRYNEVVATCEKFYDDAKDNSEKALWTRGAEKTARLALIYAISEDVEKPQISVEAVNWAWALVEHLTRRMLYQASVYVHDNEFDALRQKALRYLRDYGKNGSLTHGQLLKRMHIDADSFKRIIDTLMQCELITAAPFGKGGLTYTIHNSQ